MNEIRFTVVDDNTHLAEVRDALKNWRETDIEELESLWQGDEELLGYREPADPRWPGWLRQSWLRQRRCCERALELARRGRKIHIARDDDGYHFAVESDAK